MLSFEQRDIINQQVNSENADEFVCELILKYATSIDRSAKLLDFVPKIMLAQLDAKRFKINEYSMAVESLMIERDYNKDPRKKNEIPEIMEFTSLLYTCKAHFPNAKCDINNSVTGRNFFNELVDNVQKKKHFDYTNASDWKWIYKYTHCGVWMNQFVINNIDPKFVQPEFVNDQTQQ